MPLFNDEYERLKKLAEGMSASQRLKDEYERLTGQLSSTRILQEEYEKSRKLTESLGGLASANSALRNLFVHQRTFHDIERIRDLYEIQAGHRLNDYANLVSRSHFDEIERIRESIFGATTTVIQEAQKLFDAVSASRDLIERITGKISSSTYAHHTDRLMEISKPYIEAQKYLDRNSAHLEVLSRWFNVGRDLHVPVIDKASVETIAYLWGQVGVERQLRSFGIDADSFISNEEGASKSATGSIPCERSLPFADVLAILSIILAIVVPLWQKWDSDQMEERLSKQLHDLEEQQEAKLLLLQSLIEQALALKQPHEIGNVVFVVRSRAALIRSEPTNGAKVIAQVFPNQQLTLLSENGKWIEVEYFDWIAQERLHGWLLKKYTTRVTRKQHGRLG